MRVRRAGDDDQDLAASWRLAFLADHLGVDGFDEDVVATIRTFFREEHAADRAWSWLAEDDDGRTVGAVTLLVRPAAPHPHHPGRREGYVVNLYVDPRVRGQGCGRRLMEALLADARAAGLRRVSLHATDDGRPLYHRLGFAPEPAFLQLPLP